MRPPEHRPTRTMFLVPWIVCTVFSALFLQLSFPDAVAGESTAREELAQKAPIALVGLYLAVQYGWRFLLFLVAMITFGAATICVLIMDGVQSCADRVLLGIAIGQVYIGTLLLAIELGPFALWLFLSVSLLVGAGWLANVRGTQPNFPLRLIQFTPFFVLTFLLIVGLGKWLLPSERFESISEFFRSLFLFRF